MKPATIALIEFLASPDRPDAEFKAITRLLTSEDVSRCISAAERLRKMRKDVLQDFGDDTSLATAAHGMTALEREIYRRLRDVLLDQAGLTQSQAINALGAALPEAKHPPDKRNLRDAIRYFLTLVDGSQLLSTAQRVRNQIVHGRQKRDWSLDDDIDEALQGPGR